MTTTYNKNPGRDANARYLNTLSQKHWDRWYATERAVNAALDRLIAKGYTVEHAYDEAIKEVLG